MRVESLGLRGFRNLHPLQLDNLGDTLVVRGQNGQGKTNLLEALYLCATGRSFRHARPVELLCHGVPQASVTGVFVHSDVRHRIDITILPKRREVRLDDRLLRQSSRLLQVVNVVAFFPDDLRIAKGTPEDRRHFLDRLVASYYPDFIDISLAYNLALRSRNALLRSPLEPPRNLFQVFDEQLLRIGSRLHERREQALENVAVAAQRYFRSVMGPGPILDVQLASGVKGHEGASYEDSFRTGLTQSFRRDLAMRQTTVGPHRADLLLTIDGRDGRIFASQGQQRAIVLALKLAELTTVAERLGAAPILLLDDVSSELDQERNRLLFTTIDAMQGQLWVSTTGTAPLSLKRPGQVLDIEAGRVLPSPRSDSKA